jgi:enoyl-CoA hydratase/carnithine racemase
MMQAQKQIVRIEREGAVLCVTFDRPEKKNALTGACIWRRRRRCTTLTAIRR